MFVVWGSRTEVDYVGELEPRYCSVCGEARPVNVFLHYRVRDIWFLFRWVSRKAYAGECASCARPVAIDRKETQRALPKSPIPWLDRFGWTIGVGGFALLIAAGGVFSYFDRRNDDTYLAAPRANDLYEVDLARLTQHPQGSVMWAVARVRSVGAQGVEVQIANQYYEGLRGVQRDVDRGLARRDSYYGAEQLTIPVADLRRLHDTGVIADVVR